ncbi:hypothetical protein E2C01_004525 [Portunus trituberculatus]|uniref:Uncharacterized protein n=1 Tax=Portunus trituberculatus TaxID=210409 RepID=A0A5B7CSK1_PORTR|nr:hypothetical protein [Portunus trituberculatus]
MTEKSRSRARAGSVLHYKGDPSREQRRSSISEASNPRQPPPASAQLQFRSFYSFCLDVALHLAWAQLPFILPTL